MNESAILTEPEPATTPPPGYMQEVVYHDAHGTPRRALITNTPPLDRWDGRSGRRRVTIKVFDPDSSTDMIMSDVPGSDHPEPGCWTAGAVVGVPSRMPRPARNPLGPGGQIVESAFVPSAPVHAGIVSAEAGIPSHAGEIDGSL